MIQQNSKKCSSYTYLHLLIIIINNLEKIIPALKEIYFKGESEENNFNYLKHYGCVFTMGKLSESNEIDLNIKNKISFLEEKFLNASEIALNLNSSTFKKAIKIYSDVYLEYVNLFLRELKRKGYYEQLSSFDGEKKDAYISFLLDKEYSKEREIELEEIFKRILKQVA